MSEQDENCGNSDDSEEGAKICKLLERAAEPEVMMAGMTSEQRISFSSYQAKQKVCINISCIYQIYLESCEVHAIYCRKLGKTKWLRKLRTLLKLLALVQEMLRRL
jgi:hypothetical protein